MEGITTQSQEMKPKSGEGQHAPFARALDLMRGLDGNRGSGPIWGAGGAAGPACIQDNRETEGDDGEAVGR